MRHGAVLTEGDPRRSLLPKCRACDFVNGGRRKSGQEASSVGRGEYVACGWRAPGFAARVQHHSEVVVRVSRGALDDETGFGEMS